MGGSEGGRVGGREGVREGGRKGGSCIRTNAFGGKDRAWHETDSDLLDPALGSPRGRNGGTRAVQVVPIAANRPA